MKKMKKITNFLLSSFLVLSLCFPVMSQDNSQKATEQDILSRDNPSNQLFDGSGMQSIMSLNTVLPGNGSTSGNGRAPQGSRRFINTKYIITGAEMTASGFFGAVTSVGWRWNVPSPPAVTGPTAQSVATTGSLRVYLKDTVGSALNIGGTFIDTNGVGYTKIIDGTISIPAGLAEINIDVPAGGPGTSTFTPTPGSGVILIFVYKTTDAAVATPLGAPNCFCTAVGTGTKLLTYQSQTAGGSTGLSSTFRPETRFGAPDLADDMGVSALTSDILSPACEGSTEIFTATVKNFGTNSQAAGVPVVLRVDGIDVETKFTTTSLAQNATENISFTGLVLLPGTHVIKSYTQLAGDLNPANDTSTISYTVFSVQSTFPYVETFTNPQGWSQIGGSLWFISGNGPTNPAGKANDTAIFADFFSTAASVQATLRSRPMNFSGLTHPVIHFYVAYRTFATENDSLQVLISTDCGVTFTDVPVQYLRAQNTTPSLATRNPTTADWKPDSSGQWRHETIDLLPYAGAQNVMIGFKGYSDFGNNCYIDNFIATNADSYCASTVTVPGPYSCNPRVSTDLTNVGNPAGGELSVTEHLNNVPPSLATPVLETNTTATAPDGSIFTPAFVYGDFWYTTTYTGEDRTGYPTYNISIDLSGFGVLNPDRLYILKRADMTGSWSCQSTTRSGSILTVSGLNIFCDFALGGDDFPLPVELSSFVSTINRKDVTLNWSTSRETNNTGFDIERSVTNGEWSKVGNVTGNGTITSPMNYSFTDRNLASGNYNYRLKQIDYNGNFEYFNLSNEVIIGIPAKFDLSQNYPNPFNPATMINYDVPFDGKVSLKIFDMSGREVVTLVNEVKTAGYYSVNFNASNLSSGVYFYSLSADNFTATKKMILVK